MPKPDESDLRTAEQISDDHNVPPEGSGLMSMLSDYLPAKPEVDYIDEIKDLPEMDKISLADFFNKDDWKAEDLLTMELTDASTEKMKGLFPDIYTNGSDGEGKPSESDGESDGGLPDKKLEELSPEELIAEFKKQQSLAGTRVTKITDLDTEIAGLQDEIKELKAQSPNGELEVAEDFKLLSTDFMGNYDNVRDKYNLPKIDVLKAQLVAGDDVARVKQWQESELKGVIEKKYELLEGEFSYDPSDASQAGTASYDWDDMTSRKRADITQERQQVADRNAELARQAESQQNEDYKWYADMYENGDTEKVTTLVKSMNSTITDISTGKEESKKHPFAMRNILKGFYFDDLVNNIVKEAIDSLNQEYAKHQMYLPGTELPTDPTKVGGNINEIETFSKDNLKRSPMMSSMNFSLVDKGK